MKKFDFYLNKTEEIGYVEKIVHSLSYIAGLPEAKLYEVVLFETGEIGQIISLEKNFVEVLLLSHSTTNVGTRVVRTETQLSFPVGEVLLGRVLNPLGVSLDGLTKTLRPVVQRTIDVVPSGISDRKNINMSFETGVSIVDMVISLGKGQRELVVGDRKTGKTQFLLQSAESAINQGMVCVYAAIAKKSDDTKMIHDYFAKKKIIDNFVLVASGPSDPSGSIYLTPYSAMTVAEYFRDQGRDVLIILDDMTAHAKYYREISLLARRFPGRSSYPGDIFHIHAKLMERAGNYTLTNKLSDGKLEKKEVSITCLPVAELVMGDLSGYIQTNLMSMTDGHIFFDKDLQNEGRRPAINPFLSVTRVGRQTQSPLLRDLSRLLTGFLLHIKNLREFMHFGSELSELTKKDVELGERIMVFFDQASDETVPVNIGMVLIAALWSGYWREQEISELKKTIIESIERYKKSKKYKSEVDGFVSKSKKFSELITTVRQNESVMVKK